MTSFGLEFFYCSPARKIMQIQAECS
nr:hypothetical protein [Sicyoidochytrium minutum DNA virus]